MTRINVEDFRRLYETDGPFELIDGERIPLKPLDDGCAKVADRLHKALSEFLVESSIGAVFARTPYVLCVHPAEVIDRVRVPDLMFYQSVRFEFARKENQLDDSLPFRIAPDWAAILVSEGDSYSSVEAKIDRYFEDGGVRALWVVDLPRKVVTIMDRNVRKRFPFGTIVPGGIRGYTPGGAVIPGFQIPVKAIFE